MIIIDWYCYLTVKVGLRINVLARMKESFWHFFFNLEKKTALNHQFLEISHVQTNCILSRSIVLMGKCLNLVSYQISRV